MVNDLIWGLKVHDGSGRLLYCNGCNLFGYIFEAYYDYDADGCTEKRGDGSSVRINSDRRCCWVRDKNGELFQAPNPVLLGCVTEE